MTDLTQMIVQKQGSIEILTTDRIQMCHRGDKVVLRGPLHVMAAYRRPSGVVKASREIILRSPNETREVACNESPEDQYDINITELPGLPPAPTIMDHVVQEKHLDFNTLGNFTLFHQNDMIKIRGPARYHVEFQNKQGAARRAEDLVLNGPAEVREFVNRAGDETLIITGTLIAAAQAAVPVVAPQPQFVAPPPVAQSPPGPPLWSGAFAGRLPDGMLIKAPNNDTVYVMQGGAKRPVTGEGFNRHGYKWDCIWVVPLHEIDSVPTGSIVN